MFPLSTSLVFLTFVFQRLTPCKSETCVAAVILVALEPRVVFNFNLHFPAALSAKGAVRGAHGPMVMHALTIGRFGFSYGYGYLYRSSMTVQLAPAHLEELHTLLGLGLSLSSVLGSNVVNLRLHSTLNCALPS